MEKDKVELSRRRLGRTGYEVTELSVGGWLGLLDDPQAPAVEKSMPMLDKLAVFLIETRETALSGFSAEERETLIETLIRMKTNLIDTDDAEIFEKNDPRATVGADD